jgi:hypothetical protein
MERFTATFVVEDWTRWFYRLLVHKGGDNVRIIIEARLEDGKSSAPSESIKMAPVHRGAFGNMRGPFSRC